MISQNLLNAASKFAIFIAVFSFAENAIAQENKPIDEKSSEVVKKEDVLITGKKQQNRIDRQVYDVTGDIAAQSGTTADALNKVPQVSVDADGNVSLRGNQNVQVLVNGKETALLKGENRGAAILSMSGGDLEAIEVLNNPGAGYSSEGSGGIINLVMKKNRKPGKYLVANTTFGEESRKGINLTGSYNKDKININTGLNYRDDGREFTTSTISEYKYPTESGPATTENKGVTYGRRENIGGNFGIDYSLTDKDTIGLQLSATKMKMTPLSSRDYMVYSSSGGLIDAYNLKTDKIDENKSSSIALNWEHKGDLPNQSLKLDARYSKEEGDNEYVDIYDYVNSETSDYLNQIYQDSEKNNYVLSVDYSTPHGNNLMTMGLQTTLDDNSFDNKGYVIKDGATSVDLRKTNLFEYDQLVHAAYFTYQASLSEKWSGQVGLRIEDTEVNIKDITNGTSSSSQYVNANPSAFATYAIDNSNKIRFSYSRRLQRPRANDLNPTPQYTGSDMVKVGNPDLMPQTTDAFEIGYEYSKGKESMSVRGFYKLNDNIITSVNEIEDGKVVKSTMVNGAQSQSSGLEFNLTRRFFDKLNLNLSTNVSYNQIDPIGLNREQISGTSLGAKIMADYAITSKDRMQFMLGTQGKEYQAQGYSTARIMSMMSYSHTFNPAITFTANVTNPFDLEEVKTVVETDTLNSVSYRNTEPRVFYVGLRILMGSQPAGAKSDNPILPPMPGQHGGKPPA